MGRGCGSTDHVLVQQVVRAALRNHCMTAPCDVYPLCYDECARRNIKEVLLFPAMKPTQEQVLLQQAKTKKASPPPPPSEQMETLTVS